VLEFAISIVLGVAVAFAWMAVWVVALRAFGIQVWMPTPESRSAKRLRILQMGKLRYILIFGVLGYGVAYGLGLAVATTIDTRMTGHGHAAWGRAGAIFTAVSLLGACFHGWRNWNYLFRAEVPFPPVYPPLK